MFEYKRDMYGTVAVITQYEKPMKFVVTIDGETHDLVINLYWNEEIPSKGEHEGRITRELKSYAVGDESSYVDDLDMSVEAVLTENIRDWLLASFNYFGLGVEEADKKVKKDVDGIFEEVWKYMTELRMV